MKHNALGSIVVTRSGAKAPSPHLHPPTSSPSDPLAPLSHLLTTQKALTPDFASALSAYLLRQLPPPADPPVPKQRGRRGRPSSRSKASGTSSANSGPNM